jgi:beta-N-acetylhexosaminidase
VKTFWARISSLLRMAFIWSVLSAIGLVAWHLKHPMLFFWRGVETPVLLLLAAAGAFFALRAWRQPGWRKLEAGLRLMVCCLLLALILGQEGWFRWQQYQVRQASGAMRIVGRHFVVGLRDFDEVKPLAERGLIGGIYLTRRNLRGEDVGSLRRKIDELQALRQKAGLMPLFVMADQEGGEVAHLSPLLEPLPALATLVTEGSAESLEARAHAYGERQGRAMAALGINMNLAPVVDLKPMHNGYWLNLHTLIERRAIAADPHIVLRVASAYGAGLNDSGIQPTVKHFPGLGRVLADTHLVKANLNLAPEERAADWLPFREVTARTGAAMMLAHVGLPDIDPERPVSQSRKVVQGILRHDKGEGWNYQGILITDDMNMGAAYYDGIGRAVTRALDAGVDLVLVSYDPDQYYRALHDAAKNWRLDRIDNTLEVESAMRLQRFWDEKARTPTALQQASIMGEQ